MPLYIQKMLHLVWSGSFILAVFLGFIAIIGVIKFQPEKYNEEKGFFSGISESLMLDRSVPKIFRIMFLSSHGLAAFGLWAHFVQQCATADKITIVVIGFFACWWSVYVIRIFRKDIALNNSSAQNNSEI